MAYTLVNTHIHLFLILQYLFFTVLRGIGLTYLSQRNTFQFNKEN